MDTAAGPVPRHDWTLPEIEAIYDAPLPDLMFRAQLAHRAYHRAGEVQGCVLLSIKTGGCPEDCAYCPQSAHYRTGVERRELLSVEETLAAANDAKAQGATRFCMGAAWRDVPTANRSNVYWRWCGACARWAWKPAAPWEC